MIKLICGIELELEFNTELLGFLPIGSYHGHGLNDDGDDVNEESVAFGNRWIVEEDGSLEKTKFAEGRTAEFISLPFNANNYKVYLDSFKNTIYKTIAGRQGTISDVEKKYGMSDILCFNDSTGAHIHLTLLKGTKDEYAVYFREFSRIFKGKPVILRKAATLDILKEISSTLHNEVRKNLPDIYPIWSKHFYRPRYAAEMKKLEYDNRYLEWNLSLSDDNRIEFRSFHLRGITTWKDFYKMFEILFKTLNNIFSKELKKERAFEDTREFRQSEIEHSYTANIDRSVEIEIEKDQSYDIILD